MAGIAVVIAALFAIRIALMWTFDEPLPPPLSKIATLPVMLPSGKKGLLKDAIKPGLPTVISLWAGWCGPCYLEAPKIAELRRRVPEDRLNIVYLNVRDPYATREELADYMARY